MKAKAILATAILLTLCACDRLGFGGGGVTANQSASSTNSSTAPDGKPGGTTATAQADVPPSAGVSTSRSLAGLMGGETGDAGGAGGKDTAAIPASSSVSVDPA